MDYNNYDLIETESGDLFLRLSSKFYCLTAPLTMESRARTRIDKNEYGSYEKVGNLRQWVQEGLVAIPAPHSKTCYV